MTRDGKRDCNDMLEGLFNHPLMFVSREEYFSVVDFLNGYDSGCGKLDLQPGFYAWMVGKLDRRVSGIAWPWVALRLLPGYDSSMKGRTFPGHEREFIDGLGRLLLDYLNEKDSSVSSIVSAKYGFRPEGVTELARLLCDIFSLLEKSGGSLAGPWEGFAPNVPHFPVDVSSTENLVKAINYLAEEDKYSDDPWRGFSPSFHRRSPRMPGGTDASNAATLKVVSGLSPILRPEVSLSVDGMKSRREAISMAQCLVKGFAQMIRPDSVSFIAASIDNNALRDTNSAWTSMRTKYPVRFPEWGYVAWLSDEVASDLSSLSLARLSRFGSGWLIEFDIWDPDRVSSWWRTMMDDGLIRPIPDKQKFLPTFPSEIGPFGSDGKGEENGA